jgi:hypothetical protein
MSRIVANRHPMLPFVEGNVAGLAARTLRWLEKIGFPNTPKDVRQVLGRDRFQPDSGNWKPGYGLIDAEDAEWDAELKEVGLDLDPVFTLKAWRSLVAMGRTGALKDRRVLFWNTYNSFDYASYARTILPEEAIRNAAI